ncbi:DUF2785 domain-containing protein [Leuconostoc falkenbergense]
MRNDLSKFLMAENGQFSDSQCLFLLEHIGDPNPEIRDGLVYETFAKGFSDDIFTTEQMRYIATFITDQKLLFKNICDTSDKFSVFTRSFTALLGATILHKDNQTPFLNQNQLSIWFDWAIKYLCIETDWRGYVSKFGWAHSIAHGSDLLTEANLHHQFDSHQSRQSLQTLKSVIVKQTQPFLDDEEERLANVLLAVLSETKVDVMEVQEFIVYLDKLVWNSYEQSNGAIDDYYRLSSWKRILMTIYFNTPKLKNQIEELIDKYFIISGFKCRS